MFINIIFILGIHLKYIQYIYTLNVFKHLQSNPKTIQKARTRKQTTCESSQIKRYKQLNYLNFLVDSSRTKALLNT